MDTPSATIPTMPVSTYIIYGGPQATFTEADYVRAHDRLAKAARALGWKLMRSEGPRKGETWLADAWKVTDPKGRSEWSDHGDIVDGGFEVALGEGLDDYWDTIGKFRWGAADASRFRTYDGEDFVWEARRKVVVKDTHPASRETRQRVRGAQQDRKKGAKPSALAAALRGKR